MANVNWINGTINPPVGGEYYVILEVKRNIKDPDTGKILRHAGDIEINRDWFNAQEGCFSSIGKANPFWKVLSWAYILRPSIPEDIRPRVKAYFGKEVG